MTTLPVPFGQGLHRHRGTSRRQVLRHLSMLCVAAWMTALPSTLHSAVANQNTRTAAQWARIRRTLDPKSLAGCRRVADKLAPHMRALLKGPDWRSQTINAVVKELKANDLLPADRAPLDPKCQDEADRLRGEAQNVQSGSGAVAAAIGVAAAAVATVPVVGPVLAAILMLIAAVIMLIAQIMARALEDQSAAKEKETGRKEAASDKEADDRLRLLESDLVAEMELHPDCELSAKKKP